MYILPLLLLSKIKCKPLNWTNGPVLYSKNSLIKLLWSSLRG